MKAGKTRKQRGGDDSSRVPNTSALNLEAARLIEEQRTRPEFVPFTIPKSEPIQSDPFGILSRPASAASTASTASTVSSKSTSGSTVRKPTPPTTRRPWHGGSNTKKHTKSKRKTKKTNRRN
jgi:hypothetical protein